MTDLSTSDTAWLDPSTAPVDALPAPRTERWQPLRLGLVDLFHYDDEQFWFHDGRLLLRGNNGTGKSKVLALTLPFLLDGSVAARRVEPDADPKKRMEWNLLLGGAHPSAERTGYAWVEFGRLAGDGTPQFTTLGIGLKAASGRGMTGTWYFTTTRRIGDLRLVDESRTVLSKERLRDAIGTSGTFHTTQEAYRRAVDEALFGLGEERYAALIELLIQLRQPQLSKRPDEKALSAALTEALAPLDQAVLADVADSFRSLEEERDAIGTARDTLGAAESFLGHYGAYARIAARQRTTAVRLSNSAYEHAGRDLRKAEEEHASVLEEIADLEGRKVDNAHHRSALEGQAKALRESPEMREAENLHRVEQEASDAEESAQVAADDAAQAATAHARDEESARETAGRFAHARAVASEKDSVARRVSTAAGLADEHARLADDRTEAEPALSRRRDQISHVRGLVREVARTQTQADQARSHLDAAESTAAIRGEGVRAATTLVDERVAAYVDAVGAHLRGLRVLTVEPGADELTGAAEAWARSQSGESPARTAVEAARTAAETQLSRRGATLDQELEALDARRGQITEQVAELEAGRDPEPPVTPWRAESVRDEAGGAPLWRVVDFVDRLDDGQRAGLEAALESSGLLDAWLFADGTLRAHGDVVLGEAGVAVAGPALDSVLTPAIGPGSPVPEAVVSAVLARVGLGPSSGAELWVDTDGTWGAGPAFGSWAKEQAAYVGAGARAAHRRARIAALRGELAGLEAEIARARVQLDDLAEQRRAVAAEHAAHPRQAERDLAEAHGQVAHAERELDAARAAADEAAQRWEAADAIAREQASGLAEAAEDLGLPASTDGLEAALQAVNDYDKALVELWSAAASVRDAQAAADQAAQRATEAAATLAERTDRARRRRTDASGKRSRADELRAGVGASVAELERRLADVDDALDAAEVEEQRLGVAANGAAGREGALQERVESLTVRREEAAGTREETVQGLRSFAGTGLLRVALPELEVPEPASDDGWNLTAAIAVARTAEGALHDVDESADAWARVQDRLSKAHTELSSQMSRHGHTAIMEPRGDVNVVRVRYVHEEVDVDRLADRLRDDVEDRERLLTAREREILETYLVDEIAGHLHELLQRAQGQIDQMNRELSTRKTSTGMQLRVLWKERPDGPGGLTAARDLLLRSDATWTPADRTAIGDFLQARIAEVRQADPAGNWVEHLASALDYRQWHTFAVERFQHGQWRSASGPSSGGEKVLSVSVPLFAAATAHYNSASQYAPRLILLDEAFAGVDDDSRAKSLGLLATFDLDVVMTSEREWGCYPQVPGLAIAQLSRIDGVDAVGVTRWRWDGQRRERLADVAPQARASVVSEGEGTEESLFG